MDENSQFSFPTVELSTDTQLSKTQWEHRLNKVFCHSALKTQLDSGEVDNQLLLVLENKQPGMVDTNKPHYEALFDQGLLANFVGGSSTKRIGGDHAAEWAS